MCVKMLLFKVRVIPIQLRKLIARLLLKDVHAVSSAELTDSFGWTNREVGQFVMGQMSCCGQCFLVNMFASFVGI